MCVAYVNRKTFVWSNELILHVMLSCKYGLVHDPVQWCTQEFFSGGGSTNSVEDRGQNGDLGCGSPLVRGSGGICNLVQEIPFHI